MEITTYEEEASKDVIYLYEKEHELYLWWQHYYSQQEGEVIAEGIEIEQFMDTKLPF